jgi:hypothetical protein
LEPRNFFGRFKSTQGSTDGTDDGLAWSPRCHSSHAGPRELADNLEMKATMAILDRSLDKGLYKDTVQWDTFRRAMSTVTNISQAEREARKIL